ncbi:hypothetical protein BpHYR1_053311 [Brachionus plicatilis]|uniref:Uncharacterized protein n=1 Tax=Brachionus plicatilis TaxID=10195 RepID=A0A3M7T4D5_BRAPC|nr:hypothetical protein BpHYR1_053311 [Brachionus plicatilis]
MDEWWRLASSSDWLTRGLDCNWLCTLLNQIVSNALTILLIDLIEQIINRSVDLEHLVDRLAFKRVSKSSPTFIIP